MDLLPTLQRYCEIDTLQNDNVKGPTLSQNTARTAARPYIFQVCDKFNSMDATLADRLGEANWQRWRRLRLRIRASVSEDEWSTMRSWAFVPVYNFHDSGLESALPDTSGDEDSDSVTSHTSHLSKQSMGSSPLKPLRFPPPEVAKGLPFKCSLCGVKVTGVRRYIDWKQVWTQHYPKELR